VSAGIEHRDLVAGLDQFVSRGESRETGARDEDPFRGTTHGNRSGGNERRSEEIAPGEVVPAKPPARHDCVDVVTAAGGVGLFRAVGRNAQHQIATLTR